jgi:acyl-coenzyme A synthetase/AMP-(fatty) acid ligase/alkanesulfonate monooxygenase SsuD/methylene tetrahydromethanopterin reductase-like flavin-dependent oxidoreductase (luciferase family)
MRVGVRLPQYGGTWSGIVEAAHRIEARGFDGVWVNDHLRAPGRLATDATFEAFTTLSALAPVTTRVRLGVMVASASYRPAHLLAKITTVLDVISQGRVVLGLGAGSDVAEHGAYGIAFAAPAERTAGVRETLGVLRAMFDAPDGATVDGRLRDAPCRPEAIQPGGPPIWVAAHRPVMLRLAGGEASGIVAAFLTPEALGERRAIACQAAAEAGRPDPAVALYTFCLPVPSLPQAHAWLAPEAEALGTTPQRLLRWLRTTGLVGSLEEVRDQLAAYAAAGATDAVLALPSRIPAEVVDALAECALPRSVVGVPAPVTFPAPGVSPHANLVHLLIGTHREGGRGDDLAAIDEGGSWTFDELADAAARAAGALAAAGVRRGDRVAVLLRDSRAWLAAFLGTAWRGAVAVPMDPFSSRQIIAATLADCEPSLAITEPDLDVEMPRIGANDLEQGEPLAPAAVHPDDLAYLVYSSGSSGPPKGAMHAHRDMAVGIETYAQQVLGLGPGDRCHSSARLFTSLGFGNSFFRVLGCGATAVLDARQPNARVTVDVVERHGVTVLTGVPTFWSQLADFLTRHPDPDAFTGVRLLVSSGDSLPAPVGARVAALAGQPVLQGLGCSECSNIVLSTRPGEAADGTLGRVVPGVEVELRDPDGRRVPDGTPGQLWIKSSSNTSGYWRRSELTRDLVHGEWIRMGDVLQCDAGVFRHLGRADALFKVDAKWVSPSMVEASLLEHPGVTEAAVAGRPDERGLMRVTAWVVARPGAGADIDSELRRHVAHDLEAFMAPTVIHRVAELPRLPSGKLDRRRLQGTEEVDQ